MKLQDARQAYYDYSGKASDVARTLSFAGIALIWVFKVEGNDAPRVPNELVFPALLLAASLACDLLQYASASIFWGVFHRVKEKDSSATEDLEFQAPRWINWPTNVFFWGKLGFVAWGFALLVSYTLKRWMT